MMMRILILTGLVIVFFVEPAKAEFKFCNDTSYMLDAALAQRTKKGWQTSGWYRLYPGFCKQVIEKPLRQKTYYVYARSAFEHSGAVKIFGGTNFFCVGARKSETQQFEIRDHIFCRERDGEKVGFARVRPKSSWTQKFEDEASFPSSNHAMVAGVQRLLRENGYEIGAVDGYWGKITQRMIKAFQKKQKVPLTGSINKKLFDRLLKAAYQNLGVKAGFRLCNQTDYLIFASIGYQIFDEQLDFDDPHFESKGWLRIDSQHCAMLLREKLGQSRYYLYAEAVNPMGQVLYAGNGEPLIWAGQFPMCLKRLSFRIRGHKKCENRGFERASFLRVETKGRSGWTEYLRWND